MKPLILFLISFFFLTTPLYSQWGPLLVPIIEVEGEAGQYVDHVASVGDINHDGFGDIASSTGDTKLYRIFYGGNNPDAVPDITFCGSGELGSGDINNNGETDIVCRRWGGTNGGKKFAVYMDIFTTDTIEDFVIYLPRTDDEDGFVWNIVLDDINNDSLDEIIISDVNYDWPFGAVWIYTYSVENLDTIPTYKIIGNYSNNKNIGRSISTGDVNGDGHIDLVVHGKGGSYPIDKGYINIYFGGPSFDTIPDIKLGGSLNYNFSSDINELCVMDINGDSAVDIIIKETNYSRAFVFYGGSNLDTIPNFIFTSPTGTPANAGDVNHDGYDDIVFGSEGALGGDGAIIIYYCGAHLDTIPDGAIGGFWMSGFGFTVAGAGHFNGDDRDDIVAGGPGDGVGNTEGMFGVYTDTSHVIDVIDDGNNIKPTSFELYQNYPNPFNGNTVIPYYLSQNGKAELSIYNVLGQKVRSLVHENQTGNQRYEVEWNGKDDKGHTVSSGVYVYQLKFNNQIKSNKLNYIK